MSIPFNRRLIAYPLVAALTLVSALAWQMVNPSSAKADTVTTTSVSAGPSTFTQTVATGGASQYDTPLERCHTSPNYPLSGANPLLSEPLTTTFTSNVPLSLKVVFEGTQWYGLWKLVFTNTSTKELSVDCAVMIFRAPSNHDQHYYLNDQPTGHPQSDRVEVPLGDGTSLYVFRLGFHDVSLAMRTAYPGQTFTWQVGGTPQAALTNEMIRDSVRFYADLNLGSNLALVQKYGTTRYAN